MALNDFQCFRSFKKLPCTQLSPSIFNQLQFHFYSSSFCFITDKSSKFNNEPLSFRFSLPSIYYIHFFLYAYPELFITYQSSSYRSFSFMASEFSKVGCVLRINMSFRWYSWSLLDTYSFAGDLAGETIGLILRCYCIPTDSLDRERYFYLLRLSLISLNFISLRWLFFLFSRFFMSCFVQPSSSIFPHMGLGLAMYISIDCLIIGLSVILSRTVMVLFFELLSLIDPSTFLSYLMQVSITFSSEGMLAKIDFTWEWLFFFIVFSEYSF